MGSQLSTWKRPRMIRAVLSALFIGFVSGTISFPKLNAEPIAAADSRLPLPAQTEMITAQRSVQAIFGEAVKQARTPEAKSLVAKDLFSKRTVAGSDSERYALLTASLELASQGADPLLVLSIIDVLGHTYATDAVKLQLETLKRMTGPLSPETWETLAGRLSAAAEDAIDEARYPDAEEYATLLLMFGKRARDRRTTAGVTALRKEIAEAKKSYSRYSSLLTEATAPNATAAAKTEFGRYLCVERNNWLKGLSFLAQGDDLSLAKLANSEAAAKTPDEKLALATLWVVYAEALPQTDREPFVQHAIDIYGEVIPLLAGLAKLEAEKRLDSAVKLSGKGSANSNAWVTIFRSRDPKNWNTQLNGVTDYAVPLDSLPQDVRYVRLRRRTGEFVILRMATANLAKTVQGVRYGWEGAKSQHYGVTKLGIFDSQSDVTGQRGQVVIGVAKSHTGWGFGLPVFSGDPGMCWAGKPCAVETLEVAVLTRELTKEERKFLLE